MILLLSYKKIWLLEKIYFPDGIKIGFFILISSSVKKESFTFFYDQFLFLQLLIHLYSVQLFLLFLLLPKNHLFWKKKKRKLAPLLAFLSFGIIILSFVKVTVTCFSLYSYKYFKENRSLLVTVPDKTFPTNFNFDNMFVLDLWCISSLTKNLLPLTSEILILFWPFFIRIPIFFCSVFRLWYVLMSV